MKLELKFYSSSSRAHICAEPSGRFNLEPNSWSNQRDVERERGRREEKVLNIENESNRCVTFIVVAPINKRKMPLFGKKDSGKKVRKDGHKDIDKQIINIEDKYHLRQVLGK